MHRNTFVARKPVDPVPKTGLNDLFTIWTDWVFFKERSTGEEHIYKPTLFVCSTEERKYTVYR